MALTRINDRTAATLIAWGIDPAQVAHLCALIDRRRNRPAVRAAWRRAVFERARGHYEGCQSLRGNAVQLAGTAGHHDRPSK